MNEVFDIAHKSAETLVFAAAPLLFVLLVVAIAIGLVQSVFQLQDAAIGFVPKLIALIAAVVFGSGFILERLGALMRVALLSLGGSAS